MRIQENHHIRNLKPLLQHGVLKQTVISLEFKRLVKDCLILATTSKARMTENRNEYIRIIADTWKQFKIGQFNKDEEILDLLKMQKDDIKIEDLYEYLYFLKKQITVVGIHGNNFNQFAKEMEKKLSNSFVSDNVLSMNITDYIQDDQFSDYSVSENEKQDSVEPLFEKNMPELPFSSISQQFIDFRDLFKDKIIQVLIDQNPIDLDYDKAINQILYLKNIIEIENPGFKSMHFDRKLDKGLLQNQGTQTLQNLNYRKGYQVDSRSTSNCFSHILNSQFVNKSEMDIGCQTQGDIQLQYLDQLLLKQNLNTPESSNFLQTTQSFGKSYYPLKMDEPVFISPTPNMSRNSGIKLKAILPTIPTQISTLTSFKKRYEGRHDLFTKETIINVNPKLLRNPSKLAQLPTNINLSEIQSPLQRRQRRNVLNKSCDYSLQKLKQNQKVHSDWYRQLQAQNLQKLSKSINASNYVKISNQRNRQTPENDGIYKFIQKMEKEQYRVTFNQGFQINHSNLKNQEVNKKNRNFCCLDELIY